jgi:hypothetical protein
MNESVKQYNQQMSQIENDNYLAKKAGTLVNRTFREPYADGYAYYKIIKENQNTVKIQSIDIGDGWTIPYWGKSATIKKNYVLKKFNSRFGHQL